MTQVSNGTTIMGIQCTDGVVLGADSRATSGPYIAMRDINKVTNIKDNIYICHSGSAADTQALASYAKYFINAIQINAEGMDLPKVKVCAKILSKLTQQNKKRLQAQIIIGGVDDEGPSLYMSVQSGMLVKSHYCSGGSGSTYIAAYLDQEFSTIDENGKIVEKKFTMDEATNLIVKAINLAHLRDGYSGGPINIVRISADGAKRVVYKPADQPYTSDLIKT